MVSEENSVKSLLFLQHLERLAERSLVIGGTLWIQLQLLNELAVI